ncbi:MAG: hypothetical protein QMD77_00355 [Patescibacteria group bacterium]|nr:hypothetical protein [Patescibacteria group bacterium]
MSTLISVLYIFIIAVYVLIGLAIIFHMLRYRINRRVAVIMFLIYLGGSTFLLISNVSFFFSVDWYQIINNFGF